jgi:hypothetical protein
MGLCCNCRSPKTEEKCELCGEDVCRTCLRRLSTDAMAFEKIRPEKLRFSRYCDRCYGQEVEPVLEQYEGLVERAKDIIFISKAYRGQVFALKKASKPVEVTECPDRDETVMRLAFVAAKEGYNAIVEAEVTSKKVRNQGYQKSVWSGRGVPATLDEAKLNRDAYLEEVWRRGH